jgi:hypothetical protein
MKERWTEAEVLALPPGEQDYFERKAGKLFEQAHFRDTMAKAICAFANSGGGHIILGVKDDGTIDGMPRCANRTPTREHLEQILPNLLDHPLVSFRVHEVLPAADSDSAIPQDKVIVVIDVGDSPHAPHQARNDKTYYCRQGGHSVPASHFYLEALRNRLVAPVMSARPLGILDLHANQHEGGLFLVVRMAFEVANTGRVLARHWLVLVECKSEALIKSGAFRIDGFPRGAVAARRLPVAMKSPLLPSLSAVYESTFGLNIPSGPTSVVDLRAILDNFFSQELRMAFSVVCEAGRTSEFRLDTSLLRAWINARTVLWALPNSEKGQPLYGGHGVYCHFFGCSPDDYSDDYHLAAKCQIENRSDTDYRDLHCILVLRDDADRLLLELDIRIHRLSKGVGLHYREYVDRTAVFSHRKAEFMFVSAVASPRPPLSGDADQDVEMAEVARMKSGRSA